MDASKREEMKTRNERLRHLIRQEIPDAQEKITHGASNLSDVANYCEHLYTEASTFWQRVRET